ncbi:hypothetical protein [Massilia brevitalea]|uniref:hypothetical protein n=1 Tax=Massilia brevitalea TaxID=442526 RepID=UPI002738AAFF|nr:hypothetical protein [Massilia brevitalea]
MKFLRGTLQSEENMAETNKMEKIARVKELASRFASDSLAEAMSERFSAAQRAVSGTGGTNSTREILEEIEKNSEYLIQYSRNALAI